MTTSFTGPLATDLAAYVMMLEAAGTANKTNLNRLRELDRLTQTHGLPAGTVDEALARAWLAPSELRGPNTQYGRYHVLRRVCRFLLQRRPGTFIPGESMRPRRRPSAPPHIYSRDELRRLLDGALALRDWEDRHPCPIRSQTMHAIILLLATAGLRISEALRLTLETVDLERGVLSIRQTKFRKSRLVPVSPGTLAALRRYHALRLTAAPADATAAFFVSGRGKAYSTVYVEKMFHDLAVHAGIRPARGCGPHLHDLRSTFAVTRLLQWYREGANVMACLPRLSTYLGHACVADTEVYLRITTALLDEASQRFHRYAADVLPTGGRP
jgi:integrase/recombinase XerD